MVSGSLRMYSWDGNWWFRVFGEQNGGKWTVRTLACCLHMSLSDGHWRAWTTCHSHLLLSSLGLLAVWPLGVLSAPTKSSLDSVFLFFFRFLGRDKEINILEMRHHIKTFCRKLTVSPDDCWGSLATSLWANPFQSFRPHSVFRDIEASVKGCCTPFGACRCCAVPPLTLQEASAHCVIRPFCQRGWEVKEMVALS